MDRRFFIAGLGAVGVGAGAGHPARAAGDAIAALRRPGALAIMRHALAPGTGDPENFRLDDCATQRNLDGRGRAQARATGAALRAEGITFDRVMTSQWCRCEETARLMDVGPVEALPSLNSFFESRSEGPRQTAETLAFVATLPAAARILMVTHQVNITALTRRGVSSGELYALARGTEVPLEVTGTLLIR